MLSNCGHDESYRYQGGTAGDQTGTEWELRAWYSYPWQYMIRHPDPAVRQLISELAVEAAKNNKIGYDQNQRGTFWQQLKNSGFRPANITVNCEADCSSGVAAIVKAVGYLRGMTALQSVSADCYTGNIRASLKAVGFQVYTDPKYLNSDAYLLPGDFLLKEYGHIATNVSTGGSSGGETTPSGGDKEDEMISELFKTARVKKVYEPSKYRKVNVSDFLAVRTGPSADAPKNPYWPQLGPGNEVMEVLRLNNGWSYIYFGSGADMTVGYVATKYLK